MTNAISNNRQNLIAWLTASVLLLLAFGFQYANTSALTVPAEEDFYRDLGTANALLQGFTTQDANLVGEVRWYNPLTPALISLISLITNSTPFDIYAHAGVFLNLLAPLALFLFAARLWSLPAGCFTLTAYLFLGAHDQLTSRYATYSPWPWPYNVAQGPALLTLALLQWACSSGRTIAFIVCGLMLGLTFLTHTAPAAIIALAVVLLCLYQAWVGQWHWQQALQRLLATGIPALIVALPLLLPIYAQYRFHTLNTVPAQFESLYLGEVIHMLAAPRNLIALPALLLICFRVLVHRDRDSRLPLFVAFAAASGVLFAYGIAADILRGRGTINLPVLVPSFHFHLYVTISLYIAFGIGAAWLLQRARITERQEQALMVAVIACVVGLAWPSYSKNLDTHKFVQNAEHLAQRQELRALYQWCLANSHSDDVFLVDDFYGQFSVGAAGRKLIVLDPMFTSPYVDLDKRVDDRRALYEAIHRSDEATFNKLADQYRVRYVVTSADAMLSGLYTKQLTDTRTVAVASLQLVEDFGPVQLYRRIVR